MKKTVLAITLLLFALQGFCAPIVGNVSKEGEIDSHQVIDKQNGSPVDNATVSIPAEKVRTQTDKEGRFKIDKKIRKEAIMSVEKEGYKPFSLTINQDILANPLKLGIEKSSPTDIVISHEIIHLGDNVYSDNSANAGEFRAKAVGAFYTKNFPIVTVDPNAKTYLVIGSIIGIDTKMARDVKQNGGTNSYSTPLEVFFNGQKISEININGDGQEILLPKSLIREDNVNEVTLKTGKNLFTPYIDYDDVEFANLLIEVR